MDLRSVGRRLLLCLLARLTVWRSAAMMDLYSALQMSLRSVQLSVWMLDSRSRALYLVWSLVLLLVAVYLMVNSSVGRLDSVSARLSANLFAVHK